MATMFDTAKARKPAVPVSAKPVRPTVDGLEMVASIRMVTDWLSGLGTEFGDKVRSTAQGIFLADGMARKAQPASFDAVDGVATGNIQCRKRSSASALSELEMEALSEAGVSSYEKVDSSIEECFVINPAYLKDSALLKKVDKALKSIKDLPEDFIQKQEASSVTKYVVTDQTVVDVFSLKDEEKVRELMPLVTTYAIRPKLVDGDVKAALKRVLELVN
jgi:hypothetical protein